MKDAEIDYGALVSALLSDQSATAYEMAKRAGLTQQAVLDITKGNRANPRVETIRRLLVAAGKPWAWIDDWLASVQKPLGEQSPGSQPKHVPSPKKAAPKGKPKKGG